MDSLALLAAVESVKSRVIQNKNSDEKFKITTYALKETKNKIKFDFG